jgi:uncharacterized protein
LEYPNLTSKKKIANKNMKPALPQLKRSFEPESSFRSTSGIGYSLLPFRFIRLDAKRYVLSNFSGQYIVINREEVDQLVNKKLSKDSDLYEDLKSRHFVLDEDSTIAIELLANQYRTKQKLISQLTGLFIFVISLRCEHSCPYCQVSRQSSDRHAYDMSAETAFKSLELMFQSPSPNLKVEFQGGEPLLNFDLLKCIVLKAKEMNNAYQKEMTFVVATNLALVNESVLDFFEEHQVSVSTSLDGPSWLHNKNRPRPGGNSYELAIEGIGRSRKALGHEQVSALMTTTQASLSVPEEIIDEYAKQGFNSIFLRPLSPFGFAVKTGAVSSYNSREWLNFYERGLRYILQINLSGVFFREEYASLLIRRILTSFPTGYVDLQSPSGFGIGCLVFNYDGFIYGSDEARMLAETGETRFSLGRVESSTLESIVSSDEFIQLLASTMTESVPMCSDCGFQPYCGSDPIFHFATQRDIVGNKASSEFCQRNMEIMKMLFRILEDEPEYAKVLKSWI